MLDTQRKPQQRAVARLAQYVAVRLLTLLSMVVVSVFLTTVIANMGGYVDDVIRADTTFALGLAMKDDEYARSLSPEERAELLEHRVNVALEAQGLNQPFLLRTTRWVWRALTLDWGKAKMQRTLYAGQYTQDVHAYILDRLPRTLLLFGTANFLLFFVSIAVALTLTHIRSNWIDRLIIALTPLSSAPAWVYGMLLTVIAIQIPGLRFVTARLNEWPTEFKWAYVGLVMRHMLLPTLSIFLSKFIQSVFAWRTFFMLHYDEDYVTLAKAKGLKWGMLEKQYILRPTFPSILTNFALLLISLWQEVIILEYFFQVEGIGQLFILALARYDTPTILGLVVVFAYLLALTIFLLDITYALVDPRIRIGGERHLRAKAPRRPLRWPTLPQLRRQKPWQLPSLGALARNSRTTFQKITQNFIKMMHELLRYPSAVVGLSIIVFLIGVAIYTVATIPYADAVALWRGDQRAVHLNPKNAQPTWFDAFTRDSLPPTLAFDSRSDPIERQVTVITDEMTDITLSFPFEYTYDRYPKEMVIYFYTPPVDRLPFISLSWYTPDGREIRLGELPVRNEEAYRFVNDERLLRRLDGVAPEEALLADPADPHTPLKGRYELRVSGLMFDEPMELDAEFIIYGQIHGLAGTDARRRDLTVAILWGTGVALAFGLLAAIGATSCTLLLAAVGAWFGGWLDELLQRITEVNIVLPFLPVSLMIFTLYSKSFWVLLGVVVILNIFGSSLKNYRAIFLQAKQASYIEAARAYGTSDWRIIFRYLIPRVAPVMIPQLIILVPSYVYLESALAFLGLSDPELPTWGKLVQLALSNTITGETYHLVLQPAIILFVTGLAFALVGHTLQRILNPQLKEDL